MKALNFEQALNDEQLAAATAPDGPILVLAAAGTGKTRTLVYRVGYLVQQGVEPEAILLLTFTNRAAREMLERAQELVGPQVSGILGGTFHHMANRMLRRHAGRIGYPMDFTILDRDDARSLVGDCVKNLKLGHREFPKRDVLLSLFSMASNTGRSLESLVEERLLRGHIDPDDVRKVREAYEKRKREAAAMDFDDMLVHCLKLLKDAPSVLARYQQRFRHVLVDEYQDTNRIQAELVDLLAGGHRNLLVVGDDFQSIYAWRGADVRNILGFVDRYPDTRCYLLEQNYRSVPEILDVANAVIRGNPDQFQKSLRAVRESYKMPACVRVRDGHAQADAVIELVRRLMRDGYRASDIAVLYRAHYHSMELQIELARASIDHVVTSGVRFFEQAHIKDVCSLLRVLENPCDELAFKRLLCLLPGVGEKTADTLWKRLGGAFDASQPAVRQQVRAALRANTRQGWESVDRILADYYAEDMRSKGAEVLSRFVDASYEAYAVRAFEDPDRRLDDIRELMLQVERSESVSAFLSDVALLTNIDHEFDRTRDVDRKQALQLSTVHQAKGLEWPVVILLWLNEGLFPSSRAMEDDVGGEPEERRLFYVAVTRARDELYLCTPELRRTRDRGVYYCQPSRFLQEIPRALLRQIAPVTF
jgi:DNA helicase-2/ATP-dependent DNA helicase PcrA